MQSVDFKILVQFAEVNLYIFYNVKMFLECKKNTMDLKHWFLLHFTKLLNKKYKNIIKILQHACSFLHLQITKIVN